MIQILILYFIASSNAKLAAVWLLERHGDRTPMIQLPDVEPLTNFGELTEIGMKQLQKIGDFVRTEYIKQNEWPLEYSPKKYYFYATYMDRAKISQLSFAHGLFTNSSGPKEENGTYIFDDGLQPIPIHSVLEHNEYLLLAGLKCRRALDEIYKIQESSILENFMKKNKETIEKLFKLTGLKAEGYQIAELVDAVRYQRFHNLPLPKGMTEDDLREFTSLYNGLTSLYTPIGNRNYCEASSGYFMAKLIKEMKEVISSESRNPPDSHMLLSHFACHDSSLRFLIGCLGLEMAQNPSYGAIAAFELHINNEREQVHHRDSADERERGRDRERERERDIYNPRENSSVSKSAASNVFVRIRTDFNIDNDPKRLNLTSFVPNHCPSNEEFCPFETFISPWKDLLNQPDDSHWFNEVCGMNVSGNNTPLIAATVSLAAAFAVASIFLVILMVLNFKGAKKEQQRK
ncbi:putative acid phosphatase [Monocercomonoides exilis]|uniref:putative acid phosphatase n=1 Tax=Monocercomonoides exilis TaxID=2049356 RepID=UPI003559B054|nr:putative acid phosphatase [Monocercomonoides exilis]|eukprot:MONOS_315.1-p1 / transcript=MONOS_315.1 / gene=MONOS_315 / organism=Monocercomonoides_exilis_PA203 / gene_product=acid phosphatase / transcript_product=acid phosphatase / location=Mono_scaffold00005:125384-127442(+) / protein_length=460 / sequence_SO=supercontig / SO=protein_coding / is_pseudo=false